jgi:Fungal protein kinase
MIIKGKETKEWRGLLIDWDMCLLWDDHKARPLYGRTVSYGAFVHLCGTDGFYVGTWEFISTRILQSPVPLQHMLADDIESAFWVLIYEVLLHLKHTVDPNVLWKRMQRIFLDNSRLTNGSVVGGHEKLHVLRPVS